MKKYVLLIISLIVILTLFTGCQSGITASNKTKIIVSIVPQESFVKYIAGDLVDVVVLIPPGANPSNYQPSPMQMAQVSESKLYFSIGVPTEEANILPNIISQNKNINIIDLAAAVDVIYPPRYFEKSGDSHDHAGRDPHTWMSPKRVKIIIEKVTYELTQLMPENKDIFQANLKKFLEELDDVDEQISETLSQLDQKSFIIMHPSMGYFADDYGLDMIAIEETGSETTAKRLQTVIDYANENEIKVVFYQAEFDNQQAKTLADEINGSTLELEPLAGNYFDNLRKINQIFFDVLGK